MFRVVFGLIIIASLTLIGSTQTASAAGPEDVTIEVGDSGLFDNWFCAPEFGGAGNVCVTEVMTGATVTWDFSGLSGMQTHTTTECGASCPPAGTPLWDSGNVGPLPGGPGDPTAYTFTTPGIYIYYCTTHPLTMNGRIIVGSVGGVAEIDTAAAAALEAAEAGSGTSGTATAIAIATAVALTAGLAGAAWYTRKRLA